MGVANLLDVVDVALLVGLLEHAPRILALHGGDAMGDAVHLTPGLAVSLLTTGLAPGSRLEWAVGSTMTRLATVTALASELALDPWVHAVRLIVAHLSAVVAFSGVLAATTLLTGLRAVTREVTILTAARHMSA